MYSNKMDFDRRINIEHDHIYDMPMDNKVDRQILVLFDILHRSEKVLVSLKFLHSGMPEFNI
jgi:hypothetical protein